MSVLTPFPPAVAIDTSLFAGAAASGSPEYRAASDYCDGLVASGTAVYYSQIVRIELPHALRRIANDPRALHSRVRRQFRLQHWNRIEEVRLNWLRFGMQQFDILVSR